MPVQELDPRPVARPPGLIPAEVPPDGVTELRIHGVGGTTPRSLLGDLAPQQVAGDRIAGFYRTAELPGGSGDGSADGRRGRHVEAYSWGGLTSRSGSRALWVLLLPFALANLAGWMCSPKVHASPLRFGLHRATVRWASLALTINFLLIAAVTGMDLVGYQCGGQGECRGDRWWLALLRLPAVVDFPARRVLAGALIPLTIVLLFVWLTWRSATRYEQVRPPYADHAPPRSEQGAATPRRGLDHPEFWDGNASTRRGGWLHIAGGLAFIALVLAHTVRQALVGAGATVRTPWLGAAVLWIAAVVLLAVLVLLATETFGGRWTPRLVFACAVGAVLAGAVFAIIQPRFPQAAGWLPGVRQVSALAYLAVLIALVLVLVATLSGGRAPGAFRAGPFAAVGAAVFVLNLVLLGVMIQVADRLTDVSFAPALARTTQPIIYVDEAVGRSTPYFLGVLVALVIFAAWTGARCWLASRRAPLREEIRRPYAGSQPPPGAHELWWQAALSADARSVEPGAGLTRSDRTWLAGIARVRCWAMAPRRMDTALLIVAVAAMAILSGLSGWREVLGPAATQPFVGVGTAIITLAPFGFLLFVRRGWRDLESRRRLGIMWDVGTFWPRSYHPLAPPSYAERAVPELQRRLWYLHDRGGSVVLAAHSQGTVIAAAALLQRDGQRPPDRRVALVTFGAPLRKLYGWAFPAYFSDTALRTLADREVSRVSAWRNFSYPTDFIGGPALAGADGVDRELCDPASVWFVYGQPQPAPGRHSGYWTDPRVWYEVDRLAAGLTRTGPVPRNIEDMHST
jgi:hypothetical protein